MFLNAVLSTFVNLLLLAGLPFLIYYAYHRRRHQRTFTEIARRAGIQRGKEGYLGYCWLFSFIAAATLIFFPPSLEASVREGSAFKPFEGLGLSPQSIAMALLYGVFKTGFAEELLFRGLVAGSLSRRLNIVWANLIQALIFLAPHLLLLVVMPELWFILPVIFVGSLFAGWVRIKSDSMLGPWLLHASVNVTMALSIALRSAT